MPFLFQSRCEKYFSRFKHIITGVTDIARTGSVYVTIGVTIERYFAIVHPFSKGKFRRKNFILPLAVIFAIIYNLPKVTFMSLKNISGENSVFLYSVCPSPCVPVSAQRKSLTAKNIFRYTSKVTKKSEFHCCRHFGHYCCCCSVCYMPFSMIAQLTRAGCCDSHYLIPYASS